MQEFLEDENPGLRGDYKELALLSLLYLGGTRDKKGITIQAPSACHHARWMSKVIYTIKIALFEDQLLQLEVFENQSLVMIRALADFLTLFYTRYWLCTPSLSDAPRIDLELCKTLEDVAAKPGKETLMKEMAKASLTKLSNHLWYLSERVVPSCLFSSRVSESDKNLVRKEILKYGKSKKGDILGQIKGLNRNWGRGVNSRLKNWLTL